MPSKQEYIDMAEYYMADPVAPKLEGYGLNGYPDNVRQALWEPFTDDNTPGMQVTKIARKEYAWSWHKTTEACGYLCLFEAELCDE